MKNFLSEVDYNFYTKSRNIQIPAGKCIFTNNGFFGDEPDTEIKQNITHITTRSSIKLQKYKFSDYPKLHYFDCDAELPNISFEKLNNLKVLKIQNAHVKTKKLQNLPNIEILIFSNIIDIFFVTNMSKYKFMLDNLPNTLNTIIFDGFGDIDGEDVESYNNCEIIQFLEKKMSLQKLPFGCKTYFIDYDNKVYTITN